MKYTNKNILDYWNDTIIDCSDIEIIEKIRYKRHIFKTRRDKLITKIKNL